MRSEKFSGFAVNAKKVGFFMVVAFIPLLMTGQSAPRDASSQAKPRVYIDWKDTRFVSTEASQPFDAVAAFNRACPEAEAIRDQKHADFVVRMNHQKGPGSSDFYQWETWAQEFTSKNKRKTEALILCLYICATAA
jgi:hypothetical protein